MPFVQQCAILQQGLQHGPHIDIAAAGFRSAHGHTPQQRQTFSNEP